MIIIITEGEGACKETTEMHVGASTTLVDDSFVCCLNDDVVDMIIKILNWAVVYFSSTPT